MPAASSIAVSSARWFSWTTKSREAERLQHFAHRGNHLDFDHRRRRADRVHVALVELAEAAARGPVGAPHRLNLVALEESRQLAAVVGDDARERNGQVVAQREVGLPGGLTFAALQHLVYELVAFFAVLPGQRLDVLERRRLERLEAVALVDATHDVDDVLPPPDVLRQEVAHAARGSRIHHA